MSAVGAPGAVFPLLGVPTGRWSRQQIVDALAPLVGPTTELFGAERLVFGSHSPKDKSIADRAAWHRPRRRPAVYRI